MTYRGVVLDLDGTVYRGGELLPGAAETVDAIRELGLSLCCFSNNPTKTRAAYVDRLAGLEIEIDESEVLSAGTVTTDYLVDEHAGDDCFLIGSPGLREQLVDAGVSLTDEPTTADVVVASWDREFDYDDMTDGLRALEDPSTAFVGSDPDRTVPASGGRSVPGSGAIIGAVAAVADRDPDRVLGKPSPESIAAVEDAIGVAPGECLLVGDRLDTDIAMGERAGMTTALVLTGAADRDDVAESDVRPDHVLDGIGDVPDLLD
ncbi:HAD family hydrolase [Halorientalis sp. IM1011]|uniref:HAD-IIA family hydrolase n=1 Tax=Halorientalis sp. IM1011 TaxID=1932360 RepID=UPI00097CD4E8|nr:HAD-IIA family hydrolase [Halorientalis sp. IM1011]AQL41344.1 HAD family hydrolase [Halorientalis sp. IM1011]